MHNRAWKVQCKISLFLIWKLPNYYLFSCSFAFEGNRRKETCSAVLQDKSNGLLWRGKPRKSSHSPGFGFCFQIRWARFPVNIWNYFPANNLRTLRKCGNAHTGCPLWPAENPKLRCYTEIVLVWGTWNVIGVGGSKAKMHQHHEI